MFLYAYPKIRGGNGEHVALVAWRLAGKMHSTQK